MKVLCYSYVLFFRRKNITQFFQQFHCAETNAKHHNFTYERIISIPLTMKIVNNLVKRMQNYSFLYGQLLWKNDEMFMNLKYKRWPLVIITQQTNLLNFVLVSNIEICVFCILHLCFFQVFFKSVFQRIKKRSD